MLRDDKNDPRKQALAQEIDSYFRSELISKRNRRMANHILQLIASHPEESLFFAIGAGKCLPLSLCLIQFYRLHLQACRPIMPIRVAVGEFIFILFLERYRKKYSIYFTRMTVTISKGKNDGSKKSLFFFLERKNVKISGFDEL